ncbi:MAG: hypothetical protein ACXWNZ_19420, partial [Vulcanimicrobiaceae bacterium]
RYGGLSAIFDSGSTASTAERCTDRLASRTTVIFDPQAANHNIQGPLSMSKRNRRASRQSSALGVTT